MLVILVRAVIFYLLLMLLMRLMGKRQIGEVQVTEFVAVILVSELAAVPIVDPDIPIAHGIVPLVVIVSLEILVAYLCRISPKARALIDGKPVTLVKGGKLIKENLFKTRVTPDEIDAQIRINGYRSLKEVDLVILEQTGKLSVLPKDPANNQSSKQGGK